MASPLAFCWHIRQSTQGTRFFRSAGLWLHLPRFGKRLRDLLDMPVQLDEDGAILPPVLALSDAARLRWIKFHDAVERELGPGGAMGEVRDVASKAADNVARLAALFHVYAYGPTGSADNDAKRTNRPSRSTSMRSSRRQRGVGRRQSGGTSAWIPSSRRRPSSAGTCIRRGPSCGIWPPHASTPMQRSSMRGYSTTAGATGCRRYPGRRSTSGDRIHCAASQHSTSPSNPLLPHIECAG